VHSFSHYANRSEITKRDKGDSSLIGQNVWFSDRGALRYGLSSLTICHFVSKSIWLVWFENAFWIKVLKALMTVANICQFAFK
jgi:hypothetical protein